MRTLAASNRSSHFFWTTDRELRLTSESGNSLETIGFDMQRLRESGFSAVIAQRADSPKILAAFRRALAGEPAQFVLVTPSATLEVVVEPRYTDGGQIAGTIGSAVDSTRLANAEQTVAELQRALEQVQEMAHIAHAVVDLKTRNVRITPGWARIFGFPEDVAEIEYADIAGRVHPKDRALFRRQRAVALGSGVPFRLSYRIVRPNGDIRYLRTHTSYLPDESGAPAFGISTAIDLTEQVREREARVESERIDALTGLPNRVSLLEQLESRLDAGAEGLSLMVADLAALSAINESSGRVAGDLLLQAVAKRFEQLANRGHYAARLGSDDFALAVEGSPAALHAAEHEVRDIFAHAFTIGHDELRVRAYIGTAIATPGISAEVLTLRAEMALHAARDMTPGTIVRYSPQLEREKSMRHRLAQELGAAIAATQFELYYQPVLGAHSGQIIGAEALLRWNHPEYGTLSPAAFLDIAEEMREMDALGTWLLGRACEDCVRFSTQAGKSLRVNVNVAPRQLQDPKFCEILENVLHDSTLKPEQLELEVTEQSLVDDLNAAASTLEAVRRLGVSVAIDDFGTGYNTLSYLKAFPVTNIKIDRTFVSDIERDSFSRAICASLVALARSLDIQIVGEGIENEAQAEFLQSLGCNELQGFFYGRPMPLESFLTLLREGERRQ